MSYSALDGSLENFIGSEAKMGMGCEETGMTKGD